MLLLPLAAGTLVPDAALAAQDATPAAGGRDAPALLPGTPADEMAGMAMGTPDAAEAVEAEVATQEPAPAGTPADAATAAEAIAGAENAIACLNAGNAEGLVALMTANFLLTEFGSANPYDVIADAASFPATVESLGGAQTHADGRLSVDIVYAGIYSPNTYLHQRWYMVREDGYLKLDRFENLPIETADVTVEAAMIDFAFRLSQDRFAAGKTIAFEAPNQGRYPHEIVVVQLPEGATIEQALAGEVPEEEIGFFGFTFAEPGGTDYFGLTNLAPGSYTLACFVDEPEGVPHVARGMVAEFTVA